MTTPATPQPEDRCPWCDGEMVSAEVPHGDETAHYFRCRSCAAESPWGKSAASARGNLHRRVPAPPAEVDPAAVARAAEQAFRTVTSWWGVACNAEKDHPQFFNNGVAAVARVIADALAGGDASPKVEEKGAGER